MEQKIKEKLREIERTENIRIIYTCESGSRAWGFASQDSDYDVRFVYVRPLEEYLRLDKTRDVIEYEQNEVYDINGWDVSKLLRLAARSNPVIYEWADSPIVYKTSGDWEKIKAALGDFCLLNKLLYHYLSMCKNNVRNYFQSDEVPLKKYLYILRPILACEWIMTKRCPPPTDFNKLREAVLPKELVSFVKKLLAAKTNSNEKQTGPRFEDIDRYVQDKINEVDCFLSDNNFQQGEADWARLNALFLEIAKREEKKMPELKRWRVFEIEHCAEKYKIAAGFVYNHYRLCDGDDIQTSPIKSISVDFDNGFALMQTRNTLYKCRLEDCYFSRQDATPDAVPDYQKIREKYCGEKQESLSGENRAVLEVSASDEFYFHSMRADRNGEKIELETYPNIGNFIDSVLIENHDQEIDIRYHVREGVIEFYSLDTGGLAFYVHNVGDEMLRVALGYETIPLKTGEFTEIRQGV